MEPLFPMERHLLKGADGAEGGTCLLNPLEALPMCNLYSLNKKRDAVARFFRVSHNRAAAFEPASAIFPRHIAPVVRQSADGERELVTMSWGFMLVQQKGEHRGQ